MRPSHVTGLISGSDIKILLHLKVSIGKMSRHMYGPEPFVELFVNASCKYCSLSHCKQDIRVRNEWVQGDVIRF